MKNKIPRKADFISVVFAAVVIALVYILFATVDLVYMDGNKEIYRQNDVSVLTEVEMPEGDFNYTINGEKFDPTDDIGTKTQIITSVLTNFVGFNWEEGDNVIIVEVKDRPE